MNKCLDTLLQFLEDTISLHHCSQVEDMHLRALRYEDMPYLPLTVVPKVAPDALYPYEEAFADPAKMMYNELMYSFGSIYASVQTKDAFPLHIRSNYGIGIVPSIFGATCRILHENMPWVEPIGLPKVKEMLARGIPDVVTGLAARALETNQFYLETLKEYPKCSQTIHVTQPDMQGPFDIAHLLLGSDIFYFVYDLPTLLEDLLSMIAEVYIRYRQALAPYLSDQAGKEAIYIHGAIFKGQVLVKDDTAMTNLSPTMYQRFALPYNQQIFRAFPGALHYCGPIQPWHYQVVKELGVCSINYGNPELHDLVTVHAENQKCQRPIILWGRNQPFSFVRDVQEKQIRTGCTLACSVRDIGEGKRTLETYLQ